MTPPQRLALLDEARRDLRGFKGWLADFPTTSLVIVAAVLWSGLFVAAVLACFLIGRAVDDSNMWAMVSFLGGALGIGAAQFTAKRKTEWRPEERARAMVIAADCATPPPESPESREAAPSLAETATHRATAPAAGWVERPAQIGGAIPPGANPYAERYQDESDPPSEPADASGADGGSDGGSDAG